MRLIGMLDSPYVRRVAVSLRFMGITADLEPISVFNQYDIFAATNPVVKAPTFVTDDGVILMDSTLILDHLELMVDPHRRLSPTDIIQHAYTQRIIGLALAACEKTVQIVYEKNLRPPEKQHQPWIERIKGQLVAAYKMLEMEITSDESRFFGTRPLQAHISTAVAWRFTQENLPSLIPAKKYPALSLFSSYAEALPEFSATNPY